MAGLEKQKKTTKQITHSQAGLESKDDRLNQTLIGWTRQQRQQNKPDTYWADEIKRSLVGPDSKDDRYSLAGLGEQRRQKKTLNLLDLRAKTTEQTWHRLSRPVSSEILACEGVNRNS